MNTLKVSLFLFATLFSSLLLAEEKILIDNSAMDKISKELTDNIWKMERNTGLGKVITVWMFLNDGTGTAYQKMTRNNESSVSNHHFTYTVNNNQVIVQEEIEKEWEGHFGVTRWKLINHELLGDVKFRQEVITLKPIQL